MDATLNEWSPAERFVSGAAPSATSPAVEMQSVPSFKQFGRVDRWETVFKENHAYLPHLTTWEVPVVF